MARPTRLGNFSYVGQHQYFLTFSTYERQRFFAEPGVGENALEQLLQSSRAYSMAVAAYCLMPDHAHLLVKGLSPSADARAFISDFKRKSGWEFRRSRKRRLWRDGYHDRVLRDDSEALNFLAYTVNNPVRAGLVRTPEEYALWGSFIESRHEILRRLRGRLAESQGHLSLFTRGAKSSTLLQPEDA